MISEIENNIDVTKEDISLKINKNSDINNGPRKHRTVNINTNQT